MKKLLFLFLLLPTCSIVSMKRAAAAAEIRKYIWDNDAQSLSSQKSKEVAEEAPKYTWHDSEQSLQARYSLHQYKKTHEDGPTICTFPECPYTTASKSALQYHIKHTHHFKAKEYHCAFIGCGKKFEQLDDLRMHIFIHTAEQPYVCLECGKLCTQPSHFEAHKRTHSGEQPYRCYHPHCKKSFKCPRNLRTHEQRAHLLEESYTCSHSECKQIRFSGLSQFNKHMQKHNLSFGKRTRTASLPAAAAADQELPNFAENEFGPEFNFPDELEERELTFEEMTFLFNPDNMEL